MLCKFSQSLDLNVRRISWKADWFLARPYLPGDLFASITALCLLRCSMTSSLVATHMDAQTHRYSSIFCT